MRIENVLARRFTQATTSSPLETERPGRLLTQSRVRCAKMWSEIGENESTYGWFFSSSYLTLKPVRFWAYNTDRSAFSLWDPLPLLLLGFSSSRFDRSGLGGSLFFELFCGSLAFLIWFQISLLLCQTFNLTLEAFIKLLSWFFSLYRGYLLGFFLGFLCFLGKRR
jgi:hypothetical protein